MAGVQLVHGQQHFTGTFILALNCHRKILDSISDHFVVHARSNRSGKLRQVAVVAAKDAMEANGNLGILVKIALTPDETSLQLGYVENPDLFQLTLQENFLEPTPIANDIPLSFQVIAWQKTSEESHDGSNQGKTKDWLIPPSVFHAPGKWQVGHAFCDRKDHPIVFLWRYEAPAFFEMHSHVQSGHCSPPPPAWVHTWDSSTEIGHAQLGYGAQDMALPLIEGEMGDVITLTTEAIAAKFRSDFSNADYQSVFPFLSKHADQIACPMPMDMEYMHFDGYFGIPITQLARSRTSTTNASREVRWYCWNRIWKIGTNNRSRGKNTPPLFQSAPVSSVRGETWCYLDGWGASEYEDWGKQYAAYAMLSRKGTQHSRFLPFYHFDPRRYRIPSGRHKTVEQLEAGVPTTLDQALSQTVHSSRHNGESKFFGFKLYTALGWAPMDPFLRDPLERFYEECERDQIPLLNHCTPAGYYTHDRHHYYDLLKANGQVAPGYRDTPIDDKKWLERFAEHVPGPDTGFMAPSEEGAGNRKEECIWWFTHHYVSAQAWKRVIARFPRLKICLAHLGDSDHLSERKWSVRRPREPHHRLSNGRDRNEELTIAFEGGQMDPARTHKFLYDLIDLVTPENRVFIDLSYVILDEHNSSKFMELFAWAREHKPILLERILWGTDWPLVGNEDPVKHLKSGNMLQRYAQGFRDAVPSMPGDFFLRACFLNPLQYLDLKRIRKKLGGTAGWNWVEDMDPRHFSMDFTDDKVELLYRTNKQLHKQLT